MSYADEMWDSALSAAKAMVYQTEKDREVKLHANQVIQELLNLREQTQREAALRAKSPALQDAWEQYQSILRLIDNE